MATMQSDQFGSKIKIAKNMRKAAVEAYYSRFMQKKRLQRKANIRKMRPF